MPSPVFNVALSTQSIQYTGSNSADMDIQVPNVSIFSEAGGVLVLDYNGNHITVGTGEWVLFSTSNVFSLPNSLYLNEWACNALCSEVAGISAMGDDISDLSGDLSALETSVSGAFVRAVGVAAVPTLLLGQNTTVAVTLQPAMPDATYSAYAVTFGGVNLGGLSITSVSVVDDDTVNVALNNVGGLTVSGVTVLVHAID